MAITTQPLADILDTTTRFIGIVEMAYASLGGGMLDLDRTSDISSRVTESASDNHTLSAAGGTMVVTITSGTNSEAAGDAI